MPVNSFIIQPSANALRAAYRPIILKVAATATAGGQQPPFVSCDIYLNETYYKSIIRTSPDSFTDTDSVFIFDIQTALQEFLAINLAPVNNQNVLASPHSTAKVFCRFRASDVVDGFTVEEGTKPVQATKFTEAEPGDGLESNAFFVINSALQHEDNPDLATHMDAYKQGTWAADAYPLSHRSTYFFCKDDSDHFPFIYKGDCIEAELKLNYRLKGQSGFSSLQVGGGTTCEPIGFEADVAGNTVNVTLDSAPTGGVYVKVQIKLQSDSVWTDKGNFTAQNFSFVVAEIGDYDIRVITFCSACDSSTPETGTFTIDTVATLAWRGIDPFCVQQTFESPIYIVFELRNTTTSDVFFPNVDHPINRTQKTTKDLYAKFYSDAAHLTPVTVTQTGLKIYAKKTESNTTTAGVNTYEVVRDTEEVYTVDAAGTEVLLGSIDSDITVTSYSPYPTVSSTSDSDFVYAPFPTDLLTGGNTGLKGYTNLQQYNTINNAPTGTTKPNDSGDPDYIAPAADGVTCPAGPPKFVFVYGYGLEVSKAEVREMPGPVFKYGRVVADTSGGGYTTLLYQTIPATKFVSIKARTLDPGNTTGILKVNLTYVDNTGTMVSQIYNITDNVETAIPGSFANLVQINISNY